ncbi:MAG: flagellar hook-basal body complex protein FliE [Oscillospiraceae bacterium]
MFIVPISKMAPIDGIKEVKSDSNIGGGVNIPFGDVLKQAITSAQDAQKVSSEDAVKLSNGQVENLHEVIINGEKAATSLEFAVQVTGKAINAYNEIIRMQV